MREPFNVVLSALFAFVALSCVDSPAPVTQVVENKEPARAISFRSTSGCLIDSECVAGRYCFQGGCSWECNAEVACPAGSRCSSHGRCLSLEKISASRSRTLAATGAVSPVGSVTQRVEAEDGIDEEAVAAVPSQSPSVEVLEHPERETQVDEGAAFVELELITKDPVPEGSILYRVELTGADSETQTFRSEGTTAFVFRVPTGSAALAPDKAKTQYAYLSTSVGGYALTLIPRLPVDGIYAGEVAFREFGGSPMPIRFGLELRPQGASFAEAVERTLLLPASSQDLFSPVAESSAKARWIKRPLEYDAEQAAWVARFAHDYAVGDGSQYATTRRAVRTLRIEITQVAQKRVTGAVADRFKGIFDERSSDGVLVPGATVLSGTLNAVRVEPLPEEAALALLGSEGVPDPPTGVAAPITSCPEPLFTDMVAKANQGLPASRQVCTGIPGPEFMEVATHEARAACAIALAQTALKGPSVAAELLKHLDPNADTGGVSFQQFIERCASQEGGTCVPTPALLCAEELVTYAYLTQQEELPVAGELMSLYQATSRERFLGRQLSAFQVDTSTRLEWLRKAEAPLFLAAELKAYNAQLLVTWESKVLNAHFAVLGLQFGQSAVEVLARSPTDATARSVQQQLLLDRTQGWLGAMEALQLATSRWNELYSDDFTRNEKATSVRSRMFDLYLSAAILAQLNRSAGSSAAAAVFGSGFSALHRSVEELSLSFNERVFMRDGEVVLSRSVDPSDSSRTLLADREELARSAVRDAMDSVDRVLADITASEINAQVFTNRIITQVEELQSELVRICGLPSGCTLSALESRPECQPQIVAGRCGFLVDPTGQHYESLDTMAAQGNVSEAGAVVLKFVQSALAEQLAQEELSANEARRQLELENCNGFAQAMESWDIKRRLAAGEVEALAQEMLDIGAGAIEVEIAALQQMQQARLTAYETQKAWRAEWATTRYNGVEYDFAQRQTINALAQSAAWTELTAKEIDRLAECISEGYPKAVGMSNDLAFPARLAIGLSTYGITTGMRAAALGMTTAASVIQVNLDKEQALREAQLTELTELGELAKVDLANQTAAIEASLRMIQLETEHQIRTREALIEALNRNLANDLAHERDLIELRDRRDKVMLHIIEQPRLQTQVLRAQIGSMQTVLEYAQMVQRAQLLEGRRAALNARLNNLSELIGSPSVVFAYANRLAKAESRIERAKSLLFDWVVALEYYAVRPFIAQRLAILWARNPSQLEAIADDLLRLESICGGPVNYETAELSVRDDLLGIGFDVALESGEANLTAAERFRAVLNRGIVPVDMQVRYSSDKRIGDLITSRSVLSGTFSIRLNDFANLPLACGAKLASIDLMLVGEGLGNARPVVSVLYDGSSTMRSCQPNVSELVEGLGPGTTVFAPVTAFRTAGRSASLVASVGAFGAADSANRSFEGLPIASTYTILIDPRAGENPKIDWSALQDIRLRLAYVYQDLFPVGQCQ